MDWIAVAGSVLTVLGASVIIVRSGWLYFHPDHYDPAQNTFTVGPVALGVAIIGILILVVHFKVLTHDPCGHEDGPDDYEYQACYESHHEPERPY